jgi:hypothetical protein
MFQTGKFVCNNASAYLMYNAELDSGVFHIESLDEVGLNFLQSIGVGDKLTLLTGNVDLSLLVTDFTVHGSRIQCKAIVEK